jgi:hypothetical protein
MSLERRISQLEQAFDSAEDGPSLSERLQGALDRARESRQAGLAPEEPSDMEGPIGNRFKAARARAAQARRTLSQDEWIRCC